jgi:hypothetical protein
MLLSVTLCLQQACMSQESDTCKLVVVVASLFREIPPPASGSLICRCKPSCCKNQTARWMAK